MSQVARLVTLMISHRGNNIATRTPIKPTLIHTDAPRKGVDSSLLPVSGRSRTPPISSNLTNPDLTTLVDGAVSNEPTDLRIYSSRVSDPASTEFAGYIQIPFANQPNPHEERVTALCERYIKEPKIILTVRAADIESTPQLCGLAGG